MTTSPRDGSRLLKFNSKRRLYVLPQWRLVYVSTPKNACTSLKWLVADLGGEDLDRLRQGDLGFSPTREGQIHNRDLWQSVPDPVELPADLLASISPADGWFVFGVLRDPRLRLFSAWQDKYLLRSPGYWKHWETPGAPGAPRSADEIVDRFRSFVLEVAATPGHEALDDGHFVTQVHALNEHVVPFSRLYDMAELGDLMRDLNAHVAAQGHAGDLVLGRSNKSPFEPTAAVFADGVREAVEQIYADDFARFGDRWDFARIESRTGDWTPDAFAHAASIVASNERIADLVRAARRLRRTNRRLEEELAALRAGPSRRSKS
ncbi:sulfotransferase family 2 domain-containing protein [Microbacterium sp.]|uniref:sulfotransferase family 2 domain-containing protein n=1 Tax=Microbacterium sp. TaxID=51671 RepID=UPI0037351962